MTMAEDGAPLCGVRRCRQARIPGLYVEGLIDAGGHLVDVRVEVCPMHFDQLAPTTAQT